MTRSTTLILVPLTALALTALGLAPAFATDTVELANGKVIEGTIESSDEHTVTVRLDQGGTVALSRSQIRSITQATGVRDELQRMERQLDDRDAVSLYRLANWCGQNELEDDRSRLLWQTLELDRNHTSARKDLGYESHKGVWWRERDRAVALGQIPIDNGWQKLDDARTAAIKKHGSELLKLSAAQFNTAAGRAVSSSREAALEQFRTAPADVRRTILLDVLKGPDSRARQLAVRELGHLDDRAYVPVIALIAIKDRRKSVRDEALRVLQGWDDPDTALSFLPYVGVKNDFQRVNATRALNVFPDRRAIGPLVETAQAVWAGFGRVHIAQLTQRAYVKDYELVSGGTGMVVQEVADPVVDTFMEGVVLDIEVRRVEAVSRAAALQRASGQRLGANYANWEQWWRQNAGRPVLASLSTTGN